MSLTYAIYVTSLANLAPVSQADPDFQTDLPNIIDDAELRLYRDLDLLNTMTVQTSALTVSTRSFNLPSSAGTFVVVESFNVITPSTTTNPDQGTRNPLTPVSRE